MNLYGTRAFDLSFSSKGPYHIVQTSSASSHAPRNIGQQVVPRKRLVLYLSLHIYCSSLALAQNRTCVDITLTLIYGCIQASREISILLIAIAKQFYVIMSISCFKHAKPVTSREEERRLDDSVQTLKVSNRNPKSKRKGI